MTLKTIRDSIISIIGSDTELQVADYNVFINEGYTNIISKILDERKDFFPGTWTRLFDENTTYFSPSEDLVPKDGGKTITGVEFSAITLIQVDFGLGSGWQTLTKDSLERVLGANSTDERGSLTYHLWGDVIYIPNWDKAGTVRIYGYVIPTALSSDSDIPAFSSLLHPLLVTWGIGRAVESSSASENFLDGQRKQTEFWNTLDLILPTVILKDMTNVKSLI